MPRYLRKPCEKPLLMSQEGLLTRYRKLKKRASQNSESWLGCNKPEALDLSYTRLDLVFRFGLGLDLSLDLMPIIWIRLGFGSKYLDSGLDLV